MYTVCIRDHLMIAHSFRGEGFGPAQRLHGATYVIDVEFRSTALDDHGVVVDIARAADLLRSELEPLSYRNLDEVPEFAGRNTTTEFLAHALFERLIARIEKGDLGSAARQLASLRVTLHESHVAWASYERSLRFASQ